MGAAGSAYSMVPQCMPAEASGPSPSSCHHSVVPPTLGREACDTCQGALFPLWGFREENRASRRRASFLGCVQAPRRQMHVVGVGGHAAEGRAQLQGG